MVVVWLVGIVGGGFAGWFAASGIMALGLLGLGFRFLGAVLSGLTVGLANQFAKLPPVYPPFSVIWGPALGYSLAAAAATAFHFSEQGHHALWLAVLVAVLAGAFDLLRIVLALRAKAREMTQRWNDRMQQVQQQIVEDHYRQQAMIQRIAADVFRSLPPPGGRGGPTGSGPAR